MIKKLTAVFVNDSSGYLEHNKVMYVIFMCIIYLTKKKKKVISAI